MIQDAALKPPEKTRETDPNVLQSRASDPDANVWVSASAGTGKTKVLTDRVLRLLLPRINGDPGTLPHKILCLTYTKAAANEMSLRIHKQLSKWVVSPDEELEKQLSKLMGTTPTADIMQAARRLFAQVSDTPGGLKIMTIHAFCQSVLGRFPLEAGLSPHFELIDDHDNKTLLNKAIEKIAVHARSQEQGAYSRLLSEISEQNLLSLLRAALDHREELQLFLDEFDTFEKRLNILRQSYHAPPYSPDQVVTEFCQNIREQDIRRFSEILSKGGKTDQKNNALLLEWLSCDLDTRITRISLYKSALLTDKGKPRNITKSLYTDYPEVESLHHQICTELHRMDNDIKAAQQTEKTLDLIELAQQMLQHFSDMKSKKNVLDYTDLIILTLRLLTQSTDSVPWVLYKLDGGIDHLLVDEAQDTSRAQWEIVKVLTEEFFHGQSAQDQKRTLFVVGDEKQSIYRFQGAALEEFQSMRAYLSLAAESANMKWENIPLDTSFRSTRSILEFVDTCFTDDEMKADIGLSHDDILKHISFRYKHAGSVELWPLITPGKTQERSEWQLPVEIRDVPSASAQLAQQIAQQIQYWLETKEMLESKNRPIRAGDIMVLLRSRGAFVNQLIRNLKMANIPVSGADRLVLSDHIAVQDLLSLAKFSLHENDDLSLAEILKSPFIGMGEEELFSFAYNRKDTLWNAVQEHAAPEICDFLSEVINARNIPPYEFFAQFLNTACPADNVSGLRALQQRLGHDCLDPLSEFLNATLQYEREHTAHLQPFLVWQENNDIEIKREMEESGDAVRIMTVHGSKGLQAPIVFIPDMIQTTSSISRKLPRLVWPQRSGLQSPIWGTKQDQDCDAYSNILQTIKAQEMAEYKRLYYVAATRAEDRLIICGATPKKGGSDESWYFYAKHGMDHFKAANSEFYVEEEANFNPEIQIQRFTHPQIADAHESNNITQQAASTPLPDLPQWALESVKAEPTPPRPLRPSRPSGDEITVSSPLAQDNQYRFRRGNLTHTLLQYLPHIPPQSREERGQKFLALQAHDIPENIRQEILHETIQVMNHSNFAEIFSIGSQAEIPITGLLPSGEIISGQIDRLLIKEHEILIIDYKSNRPAAQTLDDIPAQYIQQMRAYHTAMQEAYPQHKIRCALLWTQTCVLMEVPL